MFQTAFLLKSCRLCLAMSVLLVAGATAAVPPATFQSLPPSYPVGASPLFVASANLRKMAGRQDLIVANSNTNGSSNTITVLLSNGDGTFVPQAPITVGNNPIGIAVGDFNGDGFPDLAVANVTDNTISILINKADGTGNFNAPTTISNASFVNPLAVAAAQLTASGHVDLVVTNSSQFTPTACSSSSVQVLLGNGNGTFTAQTPLTSGACPVGIAIADLGNGHPDLIVANNTGFNNPSPTNSTVSVFIGNGNGTFQSKVDYGVLIEPTLVAVADLGNGKQDVVVANQGDKSGSGTGAGISVLLGNGNGTLNTATTVDAGDRVTFLALADLNGDGKPDIAVTGKAAVSVLFGNGNGTFQAPASYFTGSRTTGVVVQDFNGDSKQDLAVVNQVTAGSVSILLNNGNGTFPAPRVYAAGVNPRTLAKGSLRSNGKLDLVTGNGNFCGSNTLCSAPNMSVLLGNGDGTFQPATGVSTETAASTASVVIGDFNEDGKPDLVAVNNSNGTMNGVDAVPGNGNGTFGARVQISNQGNPFGGAAADFTGTGKLDLAITNFFGASGTAILPNTSTPGGFIQFGAQQGFGQPTAFPQFVLATDLNGDGKPDLAVANSTQFCNPLPCTQTDSVSVLLNNSSAAGSYSFATQINLLPGNGTFPAALTAGNFNDARGGTGLDLAVADTGTNQVSVFLNTGNASAPYPLSPSANYTVGTAPNWIAIGDFNHDGHLDLAVANGPNSCGQTCPSSVSILLGNGDGTFQPAINIPFTGEQMTAVVAQDFNGDGWSDLAIADSASNSVLVLLNAGATTVNLASSANPSTFGQSVTFTATVNATVSGSPTGTVTFKDGSTVIGGPVTLSAGQASFSSSTLSVGSHSITAVYSGDSRFDPNVSTVLIQTVNGLSLGTTTSLNSAPNPSNTGQNVTLTATVTPASGSVEPSGTVTFKDGTTTIGSQALSGLNPDTAQITVSFATAGVHQLTAVYGGDANFSGSTSPVDNQTVNASGVTPTTTTISNTTISPGPTPGQLAGTIHVGQTLSITVTVSTATGTPTGNVDLLDNGAFVGQTALPGTGSNQTVNFPAIKPGLGKHSFTAHYVGDSTFASSSSAPTVINHVPKPR